MKSLNHIVIALFAAFLMLACGDSGSPEATIKGFKKAWKNMDFDAAKKYCTKESGALIDMAKGFTSANQIAEAKEKSKGIKVEIINTEIDGDNATVTVKTTTKEGESEEDTIDLKKEDGKWKVAISSGNDGPKVIVNKFYNAIKNMDLDAAKKYCTKESGKWIDIIKGFTSANQIAEAKEKSKGIKVEIINTEIDGDNATVTVKATTKEGESEEETISLKKEDGEWKVAISI